MMKEPRLFRFHWANRNTHRPSTSPKTEALSEPPAGIQVCQPPRLNSCYQACLSSPLEAWLVRRSKISTHRPVEDLRPGPSTETTMTTLLWVPNHVSTGMETEI